MRVRNVGKREDKIELQMTPMIDIVFQLLVFFIMTFNIVIPEGDFNIKMPRSAPSTASPDDSLMEPIHLRLLSDSAGELAGIRMGNTSVPSFDELHRKVRAQVGDVGGPGSTASETEVELDVDYQLKYQYVIQAITKVSGYVNPQGKVIKLIEKIKFSPPKKPT